MQRRVRHTFLLVPLFAALRPGLPAAEPEDVPVCTAGGNQTLAALAPDGQGGALAAWLDGRSGNDLDVYVRRVTANGHPADGWPADGAPACVAPGDQTAVHIAADGWGGAFVVWQDRRGSAPDIRVQHLDPFGRVGTGWPADGRVVCGAPGVQSEPRIAGDGRGGAFIVWSDHRQPFAPDIYIQHVDGRGAFESRWPIDGAPLCAADGMQRAPVLGEDGSGGVVVVWEDQRNGSSDIYAQRVPADLRAHFWGVNGRDICRASGEQERPQIASDGADGAYIVWQDLRGDYYDIFAHHILADGYTDWGWTDDGSPVSTSPGGQLAPQITADGTGGAIVTWLDTRGGSDLDVYAMRLTAHAARAPGWDLGGTALCRASGDQLYPQIASDGEGGAFVTWTDRRTGAEADIYLQRITAIGIRPACWPAEGLPVCTFGADQESPLVAGNGRGRAILAWTDWRPGATADIHAASLPGTAEETQAIDDGVLAVVASGEQLPSTSRRGTQPVPDGVGGAYVAWEDTRGGTFDIYVQRLRVDGRPAPGWPEGGVAPGVAPGRRTAPALDTDGAGGIFVTWQEERNGASGYDIYVQRIGPAGATAAGWPPGGVPACTAARAQLFPTLTRSAAGGVFLAWEDYRNGISSDVYALHLASSGARVAGWPENGAGLCTEAWDQQHTAIVASGGGALFFWSDARSGARDLYGIGITSNGGLASNWGFGGTPLCRAAGNQQHPVAIPDGAQGAYLCWLDGRSGRDAVYALRVGPEGERPLGWVQDGTPLVQTGSTARAQDLRLVSDGAGGFVAAWSLRLETTYDVRVQRMQGDGSRTPGWSPTGATVAVADGPRLFPALAPDGAGGAIVVWVDLRSGAPDVYAQHLTSGGGRDPAWSAAGLPVCDASGPQWAAGIVAAPGCGALVAWHDERRGGADLYATRAAMLPTTVDAQAALPVPALLGAQPNPFRDTTRIRLPTVPRGPVEVDIYDVAGRHVRRLLHTEAGVAAGQIAWDGRGENGAALAAGAYFVRLRGRGVEARAKVVRCP